MNDKSKSFKKVCGRIHAASVIFPAAIVFGFMFFMFGCVIWGISYIFARGCELQRESDETL